MSRFIIFTVILVSILFSGIYFFGNEQNKLSPKMSIPVSIGMSLIDTSGFEIVNKPRDFRFPEDLGPHPKYQLEWWYYTGNLRSDEGRDFGFQFTIFRYAISSKPIDRESNWGIDMFYFAHFTVTDVESNQFYSFERFGRANNEFAGATAKPYKIWIEDWILKGNDESSEVPQMNISAKEEDVELNLTLNSLKPVVLQGNKGLSKKGPNSGHASYYFSLTRLEAEGKIKIREKIFNVRGLSWMDKEWSTSALNKNQIGWDWFSLQLDDGREIMYYQLRQEDGNIDPFSSGAIIDQDGTTNPINLNKINIEVLENWPSPLGGNYPAKWRLKIPEEDLELVIDPLIANQELNLSIRYWEGAVKVSGTSKGNPITGNGYVELTGYATQLAENK